jgi:transposase
MISIKRLKLTGAAFRLFGVRCRASGPGSLTWHAALPRHHGKEQVREEAAEVLPHKEVVEQHLKERLGTLFGLEYDLLLYDITSTYFEGQAARNPQAQRGYSRDHRPDGKQVLIGLVVTRDGYPLGYEIFEGNRHDGTTVREIVTRMETRYGREQRIWVLDRGMVSEATLDWLKERDARYIVGTPRLG